MAATILLAVSGRCKCSRRDVGVRDYGCNGICHSVSSMVGVVGAARVGV